VSFCAHVCLCVCLCACVCLCLRVELSESVCLSVCAHVCLYGMVNSKVNVDLYSAIITKVSNALCVCVRVCRAVGGAVEHGATSRLLCQQHVQWPHDIPALCSVGVPHRRHSARHGGTLRVPAHAPATLVAHSV